MLDIALVEGRSSADEKSSTGTDLPQDLAAERTVIGSMLLSKTAIGEVAEVLGRDDFYRPAHQTVFDCVVELYSRGRPADAITVSAELERRHELERVGGAPYMHTLISSVPTAANAAYYAEIVAEKAVRRRMVQAGTRVIHLGYHADGEIEDDLDQAQTCVYELAQRRAQDDVRTGEELLDGTLAELDAIAGRGDELLGVPTGFADLDALTNGLQAGQFMVIAARPGQGKSTAAVDMLRTAVVRHGLAGALFSLEMGRSEIMQRILAAEARVRLERMRGGFMEDDDWTRLARRTGELRDTLDRLFIDDSPNLSMMEIRAKARRLKEQHDLRLLVVDYLQLMSAGKRVESRQQEVSEMSRNLKLLAKELEIPVIALSQLNRGPEQRVDKKPQLADLRESGSIEQDADLVMLIHRPDAFERDDPRMGEADFILAKHRGGPTATVTVAHQLHYSRFADLAQE